MSTEPIIKPIWLYLIDVSDKFGILSMLACGMCLLGLLGMGLWWLIEHDWMSKEKEESYKGTLKVLVIATLITGLLTSFIPSQKTMYSMLASNYVTPANIQYVGDSVEGCVDYIFDKVDELVNDDVEE